MKPSTQERMHQILMHMATERPLLMTAEIAEAIGLGKRRTRDLLCMLWRDGDVMRRASSSRYGFGYHTWELSQQGIIRALWMLACDEGCYVEVVGVHKITRETFEMTLEYVGPDVKFDFWTTEPRKSKPMDMYLQSDRNFKRVMEDIEVVRWSVTTMEPAIYNGESLTIQ